LGTTSTQVCALAAARASTTLACDSSNTIFLFSSSGGAWVRLVGAIDVGSVALAEAAAEPGAGSASRFCCGGCAGGSML
jgi:hypothetical protein